MDICWEGADLLAGAVLCRLDVLFLSWDYQDIIGNML